MIPPGNNINDYEIDNEVVRESTENRMGTVRKWDEYCKELIREP